MVQNRLIELLVWLFAIRSWSGAIKRVLAFTIFFALTSRLMDYLFTAGDLRPFYITFLVTMTTAWPFLAIGFFIITQLENLRAGLVYSASTDSLTGLSNRATFFELATAAHRRSKRSVLLMVDADFFKRVNDKYGHAAGDDTLRAIGRRLRSMMRQGDVVGRLGGEEFAVFLPMTPLEHGISIGNRLANGLDVPLSPDGHLLNITLSVGAVELTKHMTLDTALIHADAALYRAKANGRARVEIWQPDEAA